MTVTFQSTPSGGKATNYVKVFRACGKVSIHAFRGEGDPPAHRAVDVGGVSIHAFRGEGDKLGVVFPLPVCLFQSTPSGGKATACRHHHPQFG